MLNGKTNYVFGVRKDGKHYAYAVTVANSDNLIAFLGVDGLEHVNATSTKKEAKELADYWNECYRKNGTYMY